MRCPLGSLRAHVHRRTRVIGRLGILSVSKICWRIGSGVVSRLMRKVRPLDVGSTALTTWWVANCSGNAVGQERLRAKGVTNPATCDGDGFRRVEGHSSVEPLAAFPNVPSE